jgi:MFS family permease
MADPVQPTGGSPAEPDLSALAPLKLITFRMLWGTWLVANTCMWMSDVAAAWMMTSMTTTPLWVALVQTSATLPVFLLGLPSGALADILDRKRFFMATQFWIAAVATLLCIAVISGVLSPPLLLALTFANGIGLAMRWPVFAAIVPELVPRAQLPAALALNGIAMNVSRIVGPLVAGAIIASLGTQYVFVLNAVLSVISGFVIMRWRRIHTPNPLGRERLLGAMRVGLQYVAQSSRMRTVLAQVALFFLHSTALLALLPLIARNLHTDTMGSGAGTFTLLLASMGAGAIGAALSMARLRQWLARDSLVLRATLLQSAATVVMAIAPNAWVAALAMVFNGMAWITCANALSVSAQLSLPDWVRARGMSMYQMAIMGGSALGAALWGQAATVTSVPTALLIAAASGSVCMYLAQRWIIDTKSDNTLEEDLTPSREFKAPVADEPPGDGHVVVTIAYVIDPLRAKDFKALMQESRRSRLRQGALGWELLRDMGKPGHYIEQIVDDSWTEHLRRFDRVTASDVALRERKLAFHIGDETPVITRCVIDNSA